MKLKAVILINEKINSYVKLLIAIGTFRIPTNLISLFIIILQRRVLIVSPNCQKYFTQNF